jgi:O-antigen/teichoic acid export membrane protein
MLARRILTNFFNLSAGELLSRVATFLAFVHLARVLGTGPFGQISFVTTVVSYLLLGVTQGFDAIGMREVARDRSTLNRYTGNILAVRIVFAAALYVGVWGALAFLQLDPQVRRLLPLFALCLFSSAVSLKWVFQAQEQSVPVAASGMVVQAVFAAGCFLVRNAGEIAWVPVFRLAGELAAAAGLGLLFRRQGGRLRPVWDPPFWRTLLRDSFPLALTSALGTIQYNFDVLVLAWLTTAATVGLYAAASRVLLLFSILLVLFQISLFPTLARARAGFHDLKKISDAVLRFMVAACLPVALACTVAAPRLLELLFGAAYGAAAPALQVLIWTLPLAGVRSLYRQILVAYGLQRYELAAMTAGSIGSVAANLALAPRFGAVGSAAAALISTTVVLVSACYFVSRHVLPLPWISHLGKPLVAGVAMLGAALALSRTPLALQVAGALAVYVAVLFLVGGATLQELRVLRTARESEA